MKTSINTLNDKDLLGLCQLGKTQGYSLLYQKYSKLVFNSIYRIVNDREEAEDILQEVFVKAFSEIKTLKNAESFGGWVKRIGVNQSLNALRKNKIYFSEIDDDKMLDETDEDEQEDLEFQVKELQEAIAELAPQSRTIVNLFLFEQMSQEDIAKTLNIPHSTVRCYYHRAKKKIFDRLSQKKENERFA
ncbi:sigma-70 family RNA polymerase sigma factor [Chryseobacterium sp.]|uniref:RNA polymerase sigma factor n=1 Tax=Chryseobacterium sp. TaxID=1871047 RepID=UPI00289E6AC9|nr:sigma-70 family RNA polymerase sigma factor [Chryseobacterium sp.]